jgi:hypothetical protein
LKREIVISVVHGDVLEFDADVLALKYAQALYGADRAVYERLSGTKAELRLPKISGFTFIETHGLIEARHVLFVGVKPLREFGYAEIREFGWKTLVSLAGEAPNTRHLALTIHGPGYGLDEVEAFESELAGIVQAVTHSDLPKHLTEISLVERNLGRASRLTTSLKRILPDGRISLDDSPSPHSFGALGRDANIMLRSAGDAGKAHVFVAMPFLDAMDDVFHYGIQGAVNSAGFLCERADLSTFTGDVMDWVKTRISSAQLVVADLSSKNPNVYLEVGYAWGCKVPTVLLAKDPADLTFDVRGQRCILYKSIKALEDSLRKELQGLADVRGART